MALEIAIVTGISGIGKTHTIKPLAEADQNIQYVDLLAKEIPTLNQMTHLVLDHVGFDYDQTRRLIDEADTKGYHGVFLIGQDSRDIEQLSLNIGWSIELLGGWRDLKINIIKNGEVHTLSRQDLDSFNKLIH